MNRWTFEKDKRWIVFIPTVEISEYWNRVDFDRQIMFHFWWWHARFLYNRRGKRKAGGNPTHV